MLTHESATFHRISPAQQRFKGESRFPEWILFGDQMEGSSWTEVQYILDLWSHVRFGSKADIGLTPPTNSYNVSLKAQDSANLTD